MGALQRFLLYQLRNAIIQPFGETAQQVFARVSALRDSLDGPQVGPGLTLLLEVCLCTITMLHLLYATA